jgi:superfamily II DNA or RNA helicase
MSSFSQLLSSFEADPEKRGRQFERFVKWFLTADPEWSTQVSYVWLWDEYPNRWGRDCGIDLVFKHKNGQTWAVQAKCYSPSYEITKSDVDRFLSESNRREIDHRLLIATTDRLGANAKQVCDAQEKSVVRYLRMQLDNAAVDYPDDIRSLTLGKRKPPPEPRQYQLEALDNVVTGFKTAERGQLIMACGTGKTFVSLWVKERLDAKRTLVLVPSLGLLSQILNDWTSAARLPFDVLCVCSDQTAGRREDREDEVISSVSDLAFPVTDSAPEIATKEITQFLRGDGHRVIFSTYHSSPLIAEAQGDRGVPCFDLIVADEAHRCAGKVDSAFATVLDGTKLRSTRRLFATATPRTYKSSLKKKAEEVGVEVVDMDDEAIFGKRLHVLTFGESIRRNLLTDYRVVIVGVDDETIAEWIHSRRIVATDTGIDTDAQSLAAEISLIKAIKDWNLQRIITFHNRVKRAKRFSRELLEVSAWLGDNHRPTKALWCEHVSGDMPTIERRNKLKRLKEVGEDEVGLLSNARCLSEGVDVPALDGVAFIDARSSEIDIVQAVGRAIRLSAKKKMGTIVIPVFIEHHDDPEEAVASSNFKPIWDAIDALKGHDDALSDQLDQLRIELGAGKRSKVGEQDLSKIVLDLPTKVGADFVEALRAQLVAKTTESWMFWYGLLQDFVARRGHCAVPLRYVTANKYQLGAWVSTQRKSLNTISAERKARLDALGFIWDVLSAEWEVGFQHLLVFLREHGHCRVPQHYVNADGFRLGQWVSHQRIYKKDLSKERTSRLDALGFIWDSKAAQWEVGFKHLEAFVKEHGHCRVRHDYETADGFRLGEWVSHQSRARNEMPTKRRTRLDGLGFIWGRYTGWWEEGFAHLQAFVQQHGHRGVPHGYLCPDGYRLGAWVGNQRQTQDPMPAERKARLDALGFIWDPLTAQWEKGLQHLQAFVEEHGHCRVKRSYVSPDGYQLAAWVGTQRRSYDEMPAERKAHLDALGFIWDPFAAQWEEGFEHLQAYHQDHGDGRVPNRYLCADGFRLGAWVTRQRLFQGRLTAEQKARLDAIGFVWGVLADQWEEGLSHLQAFVHEYGHSLVPFPHVCSDGYRLGVWISGQRKGQDKLPASRKALLDALGFVWDVHGYKWEEGFHHLQAFVQEHGHCLVPQRHLCPDGYQLGAWVGNQRTKKDRMPTERKTRLDVLGFVWSVKNASPTPRSIAQTGPE